MIVPSILNANNLELKKEIEKAVAAGISRFHVDIMDGHFVPNLSFGPQLIKDFKQLFPEIEVEIHLMSYKPEIMVPAFTEAGADLIELHYESMSPSEMKSWLNYLAEHQIKSGIVLNPDTPINALSNFMDKVNQVLLMTVNPGFGGQKFILESTSRIKQVKKMIGNAIPIEVDGGINDKTAILAKDAGANIFVAGSYIFQNNIEKQIKKLAVSI